MSLEYNTGRNYNNFLKSVSNSKFTPLGEKVQKRETEFIPSMPKFISTKGEYIFYRDYYFDRKTGFEWQRKY